jgi:phosphatidylserine decarboxylase
MNHPEDLLEMDRGYIVSWGRRETSWVAFASLLIGLLCFLLQAIHSPYWLLGLLALLPLSGLLILFFRNPRRRVPMEPGVLVSPADGTVRDIEEVEESEFIRGPSIRIGVFLSVFDVHVNRSPAAGRVEWVSHRMGSHHDARDPAARRENESNSIGILRMDAGGPEGVKLLVKQISGAIARRIVCPLKEGALVARGGLVGMIKYGSRTELYIPAASGAEVLVRVGDKVKGGSTVLLTWSSAPPPAMAQNEGS